MEIILVDATPLLDNNICQEFTCTDNRIKYIRTPQETNFSLGQARNEGALVATGSYLFFMDVGAIYADAFWDQLEAAPEGRGGIVVSSNLWEID